jgi:hypothetical protein
VRGRSVHDLWWLVCVSASVSCLVVWVLTVRQDFGLQVEGDVVGCGGAEERVSGWRCGSFVGGGWDDVR